MYLKSVFAYSDFRVFLRDFYSFKKQKKGFSYEIFSRALGIKAGNYLKLVIDGKRALTLENIHGFAKVIGLSGSEFDYFESLVHMNQAANDRIRKYYKSRLDGIRGGKPKSTGRVTLSNLLSTWYYPAAIVLLDGCPHAEAEKRLSKFLPINSKEQDSVIATLVSEKLLFDDNGFWRLNISHQIFRDSAMINRHYKEFLSQQLELSRSMLKSHYDKGAKFFSHTFTLNREDFEIYENKVRNLLSEITALSDASAITDVVAQLNMQLFALPEKRQLKTN